MKISFIIIRGGKIRLIIASIIMFYILLSCDIFVPRQMVISHKNNRTKALEINLTEKERITISGIDWECARLPPYVDFSLEGRYLINSDSLRALFNDKSVDCVGEISMTDKTTGKTKNNMEGTFYASDCLIKVTLIPYKLVQNGHKKKKKKRYIPYHYPVEFFPVCFLPCDFIMVKDQKVINDTIWFYSTGLPQPGER